MEMSALLFAARYELMMGLMLFILLIQKIRSNAEHEPAFLAVVNVLLLVNTLLCFLPATSWDGFNGMFHSDATTHLEKSILSLGMLVISLSAYTWLSTHRHASEFYILLLSSLMGMYLMISSRHLLMFYLGLEMSTIPLAAAANFDLLRRKSSEAAMKLILSSAFSSALLLMGVSFIYGSTGTVMFSELAIRILPQPLAIFGFILLFAGFAFKISAVPFHLWTADVYEGSPIPVTAFLSVISKAAVVFVFITVLYDVFRPLAAYWYAMIILLAVLSIVIGNLFALRQTNIKRFLAFSSIAQVGYLLIGISGASDHSSASVIYFLLIYLFSNLAAFGVASLISVSSGKEAIDDYRGLYQSNPLLTWILTIALFSLAGVPPTAGFFGKYFLLLSGAGRGNYILLIIAALNLVVSFYYYLRIVRIMFMETTEQPLNRTPIGYFAGTALFLCLAGILLAGMYGPLYEFIASVSPAF